MATKRKKKTAKKRRSTPAARRRWPGRLWRLFLLLCGTTLGLLAPWVLYLNYQVTTEFEGRKWDLPSRVYARALEVYPGALLTLPDLRVELEAAGYREAGRVVQPGQFRMQGGTVWVDGSKSSQYVSSLLIACPLIEHDTEIRVINPTELPYIEMTLAWLDEQDIQYERMGFDCFRVFGNQSYAPFEKAIPSDWSSAAFPICAAAVTDSDLLVKGPDLNDVQGDKAIVDYLKQMGADITTEDQGLRIRGAELSGANLDINATPDALPVLAAIGCLAGGQTRLTNVAQARVKETDRITVMALELKKMGASIEELPDGLLINNSALTGARVNGHHDHRVVMALSVAALRAAGVTTVGTAEAVSVTYPDYIESMKRIGANFSLQKESE